MKINILVKILVFVFFVISADAKLVRKINQNEVQEFSTSDGLYNLQGSIYKGMYFSPEDTFCFLIPELDKKGFRLLDKSDGKNVTSTFTDANEVAAIFTDQSGHYYRLDVFMIHGAKDAKNWHEMNNHAPKGAYLIEEWIKEPTFDLDESNIETPIFITLMNLEGDKSNTYQVSGIVMANNKVYMVTTIVHAKLPEQPHPRGIDILSQAVGEAFERNTGIKNEPIKKILTLEEKKTEAREIILKLLSRLYIWPEGMYDRNKNDKNVDKKD